MSRAAPRAAEAPKAVEAPKAPNAAKAAKAVGLDLGARRIGVAVSDASGSMAFPRAAIARGGGHDADYLAVAEVVGEVGAEVVVVGLPLSLDGSEGPAAKAARAEARELEAFLVGRARTATRTTEHGGGPLPVRVELFDERFTTVDADAALGAAGHDGRARRRRVDSAAATVLLQSWLDSR